MLLSFNRVVCFFCTRALGIHANRFRAIQADQVLRSKAFEPGLILLESVEPVRAPSELILKLHFTEPVHSEPSCTESLLPFPFPRRANDLWIDKPVHRHAFAKLLMIGTVLMLALEIYLLLVICLYCSTGINKLKLKQNINYYFMLQTDNKLVTN